MSVLVLSEEELLRFRFTKVTPGYLACYYVVMLLDYCFATQLLFCIASYSC
jgi:hypothetical protein